jgi:hypothetical protein
LHLLENGRAKANALTSSGEGEFFWSKKILRIGHAIFDIFNNFSVF